MQAMQQPYPIQRGMTMGYYGRPGYYGSDLAKEDVDKMAALNIDHVCVVVIVMQETFASIRQFADFKETPPTDEVLRTIDYIHSKGMKVQLRPMLECWDGTQRINVTFPPEYTVIPGRPINHFTRWFESMIDRTLYYASFAERSGCEMFGIDSEIDQFTGLSSHWKNVVAAARSVYKGHVTSSHTGRCDFLKDLSDPEHWFYDLDSVGTSMYHPASDGPGWTKDQMLNKLEKSLLHFREIAELYGKPFYFGETGCCSTAGATTKPHGWDNPGGYDGEEQARYLDAVLSKFWDEPWFAGAYWWKWREHNVRPWLDDDPKGNKGFPVDGKPAAKVMQEWYGRTDRKA